MARAPRRAAAGAPARPCLERRYIYMKPRKPHKPHTHARLHAALSSTMHQTHTQHPGAGTHLCSRCISVAVRRAARTPLTLTHALTASSLLTPTSESNCSSIGSTTSAPLGAAYRPTPKPWPDPYSRQERSRRVCRAHPEPTPEPTLSFALALTRTTLHPSPTLALLPPASLPLLYPPHALAHVHTHTHQLWSCTTSRSERIQPGQGTLPALPPLDTGRAVRAEPRWIVTSCPAAGVAGAGGHNSPASTL